MVFPFDHITLCFASFSWILGPKVFFISPLKPSAPLGLSCRTQWVRGGELFQFSAWYPGVTTQTRGFTENKALLLEFSEITKDGNFVTL